MTEQDKKAVIDVLRRCSRDDDFSCRGCPMETNLECVTKVAKVTLSLILELTEEVGILKEQNSALSAGFETIKADTVRKMWEALETRLQKIPQHHFTLSEVGWCIDKTEKEMLEGKQ